jgi:TolA-binding protein
MLALRSAVAFVRSSRVPKGGRWWPRSARAICLAAAMSAAFPLAAEDHEAAAVRDFNTTAALQNNGFYDKALVRWTAFLKDHPADERVAKATYYLGICQLQTRKFAEAIQTFTAVGKKFPTFENAEGVAFNLGMARYQLAREGKKPAEWKTAAAEFAAVLQKFPAGPLAAKAAYLRAESLYAAGDVAGAIEAYSVLVAKHPESPQVADAVYAMGVAQQELSKFAEAAATYEKFLGNPRLAGQPLATEVRLRLGVCLYELGKFAEAEPKFADVAGRKDFELADFAMLRQGQCRVEQGKKAEAVPIFVALPKTFPKSSYKVAALIGAGKNLVETGKHAESEPSLRAAAADPAATAEEQAEAAYWLGRSLIKQGKAAEAIAVLDPVVQKLTATSLASYLAMARADALYEIPARRSESGAAYAAIAEKHPDHPLGPEAEYMAALVPLGAEDFAAARQRAEKFLERRKDPANPLRPLVLFIAAEATLRGDGQKDAAQRAKAESLYRQLIDAHPGHDRVPRSAVRVGWCLLEGGKPADAVAFLSGRVATFSDPETAAEAHQLIGRGEARQGRHAEAVAAFEKSLAAKPDRGRADEVLFEAAQSERAAGQAAAAGKRLEQLLARFPGSALRPTAILQLGELARDGRDLDAAIKRFDEVTRTFSASGVAPAARYGLAAAYEAKGEHAKSAAELDKLLAGPVDAALKASGLFLRGVVRQQLGQFDPAAEDLRAFLATNPPAAETLDARYSLAMCRIGQKKPAEAQAELDAILKADKASKNADRIRYEIGHEWLAQQKIIEATAAFAALTADHPASPLAAEAFFHVGRGREEAASGADDTARQKSLELAAAAYAAGLAAAGDPNLKEKIQYKLGDVRYRQKNFAEASRVLLAEVAEFPRGALTPAARYLAAESLFEQGKFQEAQPLFEKTAADKVDKYLARALYRAGACAGNLKNWPASQAHFAALLAAFPKFEQAAEARYGLAVALQNQNQLDKAVALFEEVTRQTESETGAKARFMAGEIDFARKKYADAIEDFLAVTVGYPYPEWQGLAQFETGRCLMELGDKAKAIAAFETLLQKYPQHARAADATRLIQELRK